MRLRLTMLPRLIAKIVEQRRVSMRALTACALATLMASTVHAQLMDGLVYPSEAPSGAQRLGKACPSATRKCRQTKACLWDQVGRPRH